MVPNANARFFLLKAKQRDLIAACGGQIRSAEICHYGKSTVGRWADPNSPELMPLDAIFALEEECGRYDMSEAIAAARGRRLAEGAEVPAANGEILARFAEVAMRAGELTSTGAMAFSDLKLTPAEAALLDRGARQLEDALAALRRDAAHVKAEGGIKLAEPR